MSCLDDLQPSWYWKNDEEVRRTVRSKLSALGWRVFLEAEKGFDPGLSKAVSTRFLNFLVDEFPANVEDGK